MSKVIVFDIDGTLALIEHRLHFIKNKPKNWKAFNKGIPMDILNSPVADVLFRMAYDLDNIMIIATGREETVRKDTEEWLNKYGILPHVEKVYMRNAKDYRDDGIVKAEFVEDITTNFGKPVMWFDDRPRVVKAIRKMGIFVFDVFQGEKDF